MDLVPHLVVIGLQKTSGPYLGIWRQNEFLDSLLQEPKDLYPIQKRFP